MKLKFGRNYTKQGYQLNYLKPDAKLSVYPKNSVCQFRIELPEILPLIWRRIQVPADYNFWDLHVAIQDAMGWLDTHLHYFEFTSRSKKKPVHIGIPDLDSRGEEAAVEVFPGWEIPMTTYFNNLGVEARYRYDYGDSWWHTVQLEGYLVHEKDEKYPKCIDGAQACPPENCGGESGFHDLIEILSNPDLEEFESTKTWLGDWHPDRFSKESIRFQNPYKRWHTAFLEK